MAKGRHVARGPSRAANAKGKHIPGKAPKGVSKVSKSACSKTGKQQHQKQSQKGAASNSHAGLAQVPRMLELPLEPSSKILLIGEGDFSFSASLATHHGCTHLVATTYESSTSLIEKHPISGEENMHLITEASSTNRILYSVDGTKLGLPSVPGGAEMRKLAGSFDTVWFNFPHVGGKSTDVNRQVRANQALVVGFLESAKRMLRPGGAAVVALFEGMPYELWGIRNLARHVGLKVERSGRFEWERFPGYEHKRTLGDLESGGGWKGEDRDARIYVFRKEGGEIAEGIKKRNQNHDQDTEDEID